MNRLTCHLLLLLLPSLVWSQSEDPALTARAEAINKWSSAVGIWEGQYRIESAPQALREILEKQGNHQAELAFRLVLTEDDATAFAKWEPGSDWSEIGTESNLLQDKIAWHVFISSEGGAWLERWFLSFMRIEEEAANFVVTRTVHNWHDAGEEGYLKTYYVFGAGQVQRVSTLD